MLNKSLAIPLLTGRRSPDGAQEQGCQHHGTRTAPMPRIVPLHSPQQPKMVLPGKTRLASSITRLTHLLLLETHLISALGRVGRPRSEEIPESGPTWQQVSVTIASTVIGAGVLGLPFALSHAGWVGLLLILGMTALAGHTAKMVVWSFNTVNERKRKHPGKLLPLSTRSSLILSHPIQVAPPSVVCVESRLTTCHPSLCNLIPS